MYDSALPKFVNNHNMTVELCYDESLKNKFNKLILN